MVSSNTSTHFEAVYAIKRVLEANNCTKVR